MIEIKVDNKRGPVLFYDLILNDDLELEFRRNSFNLFKGKTVVFKEDRDALLVKEMGSLIPIGSDNSRKLKEVLDTLVLEISSLYRNILMGQEPVLLTESGLDDFPYIMTTPTILESKIYSPKYLKALEYAFSDECLKRIDVNICPGFKDYSDMQRKVGSMVKKLNLKPNYTYKGNKVIKTTLRELLTLNAKNTA